MPMSNLERVKRMLEVNHADIIRALADEFRTQSELQLIISNLNTAFYAISEACLNLKMYSPKVHTFVDTLGNQLSTGILSKDMPILMTTIASPRSIMNMVTPEFGIHMEKLDAYSSAARLSAKVLKSRNTLLNTAANMMTIMDIIAHISSRKNSHSVHSLHVIGDTAHYIAHLNHNINLAAVSSMNFMFSNSMPNSFISAIDDEPGDSLMMESDGVSIVISHTFTNGSVFIMDDSGNTYLNGQSSAKTKYVYFQCYKSYASDYVFPEYTHVYLLDRGELLLNQNDNYYK